MNILDYSVFVFDLDGVIINSEFIHYECYKEVFKTEINYDLDWNAYCKIHHSIDNTFEKQFPETYKEIYYKKNELYKTRIKNVELIFGFYEFFKLLIKNGKYICIVTDASDEVFNLICDKYTFLKKSNIIITRSNIKKRKPDSECYLTLLKKLPPNIENHEIISFEDSYKGWTAAQNVIYNCILVNNTSYIYYDTIKPQNIIQNFDKILDLKLNQINYRPFYVSSKTIHRDKWIELRKQFPIIANWININKSKENLNSIDKEQICNIIKDDINIVDFGILYLEQNEKDHIGSLIEIGLLLANSKQIYICGDNIFKDEVLFNFKEYLNFNYINNNNLSEIFNRIQYDMNDDYKHFIKKIPSHMQQNIQQINEKPIDYIVICASGKGTRLLPITKDIPKLLVNIDNLNILNKIIDYWRKYSNKFIVIIDSKYNGVVDFYLKLLNIQYEIINVDCNNGEENSYTLNKALNHDKYTNTKILITWCDIYPDSIIPEQVFDNKNIIFTYKNYGRYDAIDNTIIKTPYGNIIGIYYFASFNHIHNFEPKMDICDCYKNNFGDFITYEIENLTDIGDYQKLCYYVNNKKQNYSTRYFNRIIDLSDNILEKRSTCSYGNIIITNEMSFYKYNSLDNIPEIVEFGYDSFKMKKILNAKNAIEIFNNCHIASRNRILKNIINEIEKIHNLEKIKVSKCILLEDIKIEFYEKVLQRLNNIQPLISCFNNIKYVNNIRIKYDHKYIIDDIYQRIKTYILENENDIEYNTIHGDPHMSNILIDNNNKIWFIDPRGYFGNTKLFGLKEYDFGKIIYSLSGFDQINNNDNHFFIIDEKQNIYTNINNNIDNYLHLFDMYDKHDVLDILSSIISNITGCLMSHISSSLSLQTSLIS
jgi:beta-phosphoglucomutase-like phosphatase (HAD superfamily)/NDP-sugar pyrophosphorylase family protein